jgi:hypothetical protein
MARSNRMKELIWKNKFKHRLGPGGYKATIPLWTKKEQELCKAGILDPLEGCTLRTRNWIQGRSHIDDKGQLVTSNSDITRVIENVKDLITKEKTGKFEPQDQKDQLSAALETEEHRGRTRAISSIASWKVGFAEDVHIYKKHGRHDIGAESANNEQQFTSQFFNFLKKHLELVISQVSIPQINLEVGTAMPQVVPAPSSVGSAPDNQKYHVDDINEPTHCTLLYVKGKMLRTIKIADATVMATHIMHGQPVLSECVVVEFEDLAYPDEEEGIKKLKMLKGISSYGPIKI